MAGMNENLWSEKACSVLIPSLPLWIIEYAWSKRMMEVLEVLGPPLWLEGDWNILSLEEPCKIRVVAAEVWRIVQTRDIEHFERVTEFLDFTYRLVPRLVTPIKHMKLMFGLQTLVVMWMLWNDQITAKISEKIESLFPNSLPEYHKCSQRHMKLMQKNREDFKSFAHVLARNRETREAYIRDLIEEQYGERYAQKLEERLSHYLEELDKALPQLTYIEQVLKQTYPQGKGEKILNQLLSRDGASQAIALRRLLHCAVTTNLSLDDSTAPSLNSITSEEQRNVEVVNPSHGTLHVAFRPSQESTKEDRLSQTCLKEFCLSQGLWQNRDRGTTLTPQSSKEMCDDGPMLTSTQVSGSLEPEINQIDFSPSLHEEKEPVWSSRQQKQTKTDLDTEQKEPEHELAEQMCSRHGKKMKSILQECSEELDVDAVHAECTPTSPQSTPPLQTVALRHASPNQHSLSTNTSVSSHQDSSSTNISMSYIEQVTLSPESSSHQQNILTSTSSKEQVSPQSSSSSKSTASKQLISTPRINAGQILETVGQVLASVVFTDPSKNNGHNLKLSLESQSFLMQSKWLQPQVRLHRLSKEEFARATTSASDISEKEQDAEEQEYMFFDVNSLYSDTDSDSETDSDDPEYKPNED
ncbi:uncharacterized protein LOC127455899 [Myxocyprinus asiaticus]|uniref:uncharacterized protein LOC127455899 n=1 Tax=Myxocyprinus asiaticus TaxID=70543 RepID=UPI002221394F|nr:uncharacterized protein LOC127455899 [Myxocyprinus asiaticus]